MQIVRMIVWVLVLAALLAFSVLNWDPVQVTIWKDLVVDTKVPALVIIAFLAGLLPMWLVHRGVTWRLNRRIATLETAVRNSSAPPVTASDPAVQDENGVHERAAEPAAATEHRVEQRDPYTPTAPNAATAPERMRDERTGDE